MKAFSNAISVKFHAKILMRFSQPNGDDARSGTTVQVCTPMPHRNCGLNYISAGSLNVHGVYNNTTVFGKCTMTME